MLNRHGVIAGNALALGFFSVGIARAGELQDLLGQYALLDQIAFTASVQVSIDRPDENGFCCALTAGDSEVINGWFSYIADGSKWRMDSHLDPTKYPGMDTAMIFDGATFAYQAMDVCVLSVDDGPPPAVLGMMLLNPVFEPLQFLFPLDESNEGSQPQLADVKAVASATTLGTIQWTSVVVGGKTLDRTEFPGATYNGIAYTHHVYTKPGAHDRPVIIDRVDAAGGVITRARLSHYEDAISATGATTAWPRTVEWEVYEPNSGVLIAEISMVIDAVSVNDPDDIDPIAFDIQSLPAASTTSYNGVILP
ncbi:MAG: hypothetical protein R3B57_01900 [Phycisphaerales bacterium]